MRFVLATEPQLGGTYEDLLAAALAAEHGGLEGFSRSDHYYSGQPGLPTTDAFVSLGGLARETNTIRLCLLVSPITFRHPSVIAKAAASLDQMAQGRFDLGLGTGWMEEEHQAFGIPLPPTSERFQRLEEALRYMRASIAGIEYEGSYYRLKADVRPRPEALRLIVGGSGSKKTPAIAGRLADEYNLPLDSPRDVAIKIKRMEDAAVAEGRNPRDITVSLLGPGLLAKSQKQSLALIRQAAEARGQGVKELEDRWRNSWVPAGPYAQAAEAFAAFEAVGVSKYYLQCFDLSNRAGIAGQVDLASQLMG